MDTLTEQGGTDLGRRILDYRHQAGLSRQEAAARAGMAPSYLKYLETSRSPNPAPSALARLADALDVSAGALAGATLPLPPSARRPVPEPMSPAQCRRCLGTGGVGRMVFAGPRGPEAIPVNYAMLDGDVVVRTGRHASLVARVAQTRVSFEVDHLDQALGEGWSVLASGLTRVVTTRRELEEVRSLGIEPWAGGNKDAYLRITITDITGRRIPPAHEAAGESDAEYWRLPCQANSTEYSPDTTDHPAASTH
jgi:nitroimidazol reductase NimA-like FMN-containing flavoprotein (pyridoxamine 5'-phosphate oxidase superfamily)